MQSVRLSLLCVIVLVTAGTFSVTIQADDDPRLGESREMVQDFTGRLQAALQSAMSSGGPANAIGVCKDVAPSIASELSRESGAAVSRTSLRLRNPSNLPRDWQVDVLQKFDASDATDAAPEFYESRPDGQFRYVKAIPTGGLCLACHGSEIPPEIGELLDEHYPHDRARGYAAGEIRGAFSIIWPASTPRSHPRPE
jgi:hypothetical protein